MASDNWTRNPHLECLKEESLSVCARLDPGNTAPTSLQAPALLAVYSRRPRFVLPTPPQNLRVLVRALDHSRLHTPLQQSLPIRLPLGSPQAPSSSGLYSRGSHFVLSTLPQHQGVLGSLPTQGSKATTTSLGSPWAPSCSGPPVPWVPLRPLNPSSAPGARHGAGEPSPESRDPADHSTPLGPH